MSYLQAIILYCLKKMKGERTEYAVYHLLKGKKSSQTIQDGHLYLVSEFFNSYPKLDRKQFDHHIQKLEVKGFLVLWKNQYSISDEGKVQLANFFNIHPFPNSLNGWRVGDSSIVWWKRLSLLVQVLSHYIRKEQKYYPVQREQEIQEWMKRFIRENKEDIDNLNEILLDELVKLLSNEDFPDDPVLFTNMLTGGEQIGLTTLQAAEKLNIEPDEFRFRYLNVLHYLVNEILENYDRYPLLYSLLKQQKQTQILTQSTKETYRLLTRGMEVDVIAKVRKLKKSTIEDHLVEIALVDPQFSIDDYVHPDAQKSVIEAIQIIKQKKLKLIKEKIPLLSYFQIRLVLAKFGDKV
ncbi:helix-turn-helix domain-containing protein [Rossellomorea sp. BNER]|uniref:helix-turn-helix domain-containing protein n=1 Tax=Rossellomorea sp. BNER TaxID=2962031 RepID=UPI003AF24EEA|nr:helix-turn-helix domain-containing protein [Rossellomorea sp. BNER]